jgi:hypothetical protein
MHTQKTILFSPDRNAVFFSFFLVLAGKILLCESVALDRFKHAAKLLLQVNDHHHM